MPKVTEGRLERAVARQLQRLVRRPVSMVTNGGAEPMARVQSRLGIGIYSVPEAARLSGVSAQRIRRWLRGYQYSVRGERRTSSAVVVADYGIPGRALNLSFLDLLEVRFIDEFRKAGVGWKAIRIASQRAREILERDHPFSTKRFRTDGKTILLEIAREEDEDELLDLVKDQFAFRKVLWPYLYKGLDFGPEDIAERWWPMDRRRSVVVDPSRSFGQPIVNREGVPTAALAEGFRAESSLERVASWFEVSIRSVRDAVDFEEQLRAA